MVGAADRSVERQTQPTRFDKAVAIKVGAANNAA